MRSLENAERWSKGERVPGVRVTQFPPVDIRKIRTRLKLNQQEFSRRFGLSLDSVQNWEQGRTVPDGPAKVLLAVISVNPKAVEKALSVYQASG
ncbi:MAG: helix-turn-helix domain-containing protein [Acidobacteriia bacterium]|nr:helix-turn-helix domain-containing protein [Terriglobia bacterium]